MKKLTFTEAQIVFTLHQAETGTRVGEVCRKMGISEATFYNWKKKYGSFRDECLNLHWFLSLEDARQRLRPGEASYNSFRPHSSLDGLTPEQYIEQHLQNKTDSLLLTG